MRSLRSLAWVGFGITACGLVFNACSESDSSNGSTPGVGGSGGVFFPKDSSTEAAGGTSAGGSGGTSAKGGSGGTVPDASQGGSGAGGPGDSGLFDIYITDTAWLDGTWDGFLPNCTSLPDSGPVDSGTSDAPLSEAAAPTEAGVGEGGEQDAAEGGSAPKECFSDKAHWSMNNYNPCIWGTNPYGSEGAMSTIAVTAADGGVSYKCDMSADPLATPPVLPKTPWAQVKMLAQCAGVYKLCYELRAGDLQNPSASDCVLAYVCSIGTYSTPNSEQAMPDMPAWTTNDTACSQKWFDKGGYGLRWVSGVSVDCDVIPDHVIGAFPYCPTKCVLPENSGLPECVDC